MIMHLKRYISFLFSKKLPKHQNVVVFKYDIVEFVYLYKFTEFSKNQNVFFLQDHLYIFTKLLVIMLISMFDMQY